MKSQIKIRLTYIKHFGPQCMACCCPFGNVFSAALIFCISTSVLCARVCVLVRPGRVFMLADSCRHCVKCVWHIKGSVCAEASFEIYVALVSWFIFRWLQLAGMTINCHCPSVFMSQRQASSSAPCSPSSMALLWKVVNVRSACSPGQ